MPLPLAPHNPVQNAPGLPHQKFKIKRRPVPELPTEERRGLADSNLNQQQHPVHRRGSRVTFTPSAPSSPSSLHVRRRSENPEYHRNDTPSSPPVIDFRDDMGLTYYGNRSGRAEDPFADPVYTLALHNDHNFYDSWNSPESEDDEWHEEWAALAAVQYPSLNDGHTTLLQGHNSNDLLSDFPDDEDVVLTYSYLDAPRLASTQMVQAEHWLQWTLNPFHHEIYASYFLPRSEEMRMEREYMARQSQKLVAEAILHRARNNPLPSRGRRPNFYVNENGECQKCEYVPSPLSEVVTIYFY